MNTNYLQSSEVKAFPLAKSRAAISLDITSRIFYEQNVSNIIRQLTSRPGFIISGTVDDQGNVINGPLKIDIQGYYFEISEKSNLIPVAGEVDKNSTKIYVGIRLSSPESITDDSGSTIITPQEIIGQDYQNEYQGLYFCYNALPSEFIGFQLLQGAGSGDNKTWSLFEKSFTKFDYTNDLNITFIDGKN